MSRSAWPSPPYRNTDLFSSYYLDDRIDSLDAWDCDEEAKEAFEQLCDLWELEKDLVDSYNEDELLDSWIDDVLNILGFGTLSETTLPDGSGYNDRLLFDSHEARRDAVLRRKNGDSEAMYNLASALLEAKQWNSDFTKRFSEERSYRDASQQTKFYLEHTPERLNWGILTDGRHWRLYGTKDYATETYYEVDLPKLLESGDIEQFKYFYTFFRPAAFHEIAGASYLDTVWNESETAAQELGEDLQNNVFTALRVLGEGFIETNDLDLDPDDEEARAELKEQSLVLLYRLMFVLYAEAEGLIHPEDPRAESDYQESFSLEQLRLEIHNEVQAGESFEDYSEYSTSMWGRLQDLFRLIDQGEESLGIPPYNGGLFDSEQHSFLAENQVANRYIAEVVYRLATTKSEDGSFVLADYADLNTRHLGTIYEGLLEHQFRIAPEQYTAISEDNGQVWKPVSEINDKRVVETVDKGELYVVNDEGERKATGAYYTPDYVVTYIVEETIGPVIEDIDADLKERGLEQSDREYFAQFWRQVLDLKILDPAMGSGHFLTRATGYLTERVMEIVREQEIQSYDEQDLRRAIAKECIYGVDVNEMAVELAKLSMWLETLAADQPLAFLDHHLKTGNSLVGSDITEVLSNGGEGTETGQITLFQAFEQTRQHALDHVMDRMSELLSINNETLSDVKSMEEIYSDIRADSLYQRLFSMANVHTAEQFGLSVPDDADERMAEAIEDSDEWDKIKEQDWYRTAQTMSDEKRFFHWDLEFPEVFFDMDGKQMENAGFHAVLSNPPYIRVQNLRQSDPELTNYLTTGEHYTTTEGRFDIYAPFVERGSQLAVEGRMNYILPNKFMESGGGKPLRQYLLENNLPSEIVDFGQYQVFQGVTTYTCILSLHGKGRKFDYLQASGAVESSGGIETLDRISMDIGDFSSKPWILTGPHEQKVIEKIEDVGDSLSDSSQQILQGMKSGDNAVLFVETIDWGETVKIRSPANDVVYDIEPDLVEPIILGDSISRYEPPETDLGVIYPYEESKNQTTIIPEHRLESNYPLTYRYLDEFRERLTNRRSEHMRYETWYALNRPRKKSFFENPKIIVPDICNQSEFTLDDEGSIYIGNTGYGIVPTDNSRSVRRFLLSILNSSTTWFYIYQTSTVLENDFRRFLASYLGPLPIPQPVVKSETVDSDGNFERFHKDFEVNSQVPHVENSKEFLSYLGGELTDLHKRRFSLNLNLLDYLGNYSDGSTLSKLGYQPPAGLSDSLLMKTESDASNYEKLRITEARVERDGSDMTVFAVPYVKPVADEEYETNSRGYATLDSIPAMRFSDLSEQQMTLIEVFVPYAVDKAGGFAGYRDNATATISLLDRLENLTLPVLSDVEDGLERYAGTRDQASELDEKIERTDELIDEIVYELYGLTDEEIEVVEETVGD